MRLWIQFDQRTLGSWCRRKWLLGSGWWLWLLAGCSLQEKCLEQNWSNTWSLITSCCFDRLYVLFMCVFSWGPRRIMVSLYGSSPQVKCLAQTGLVAVAPAPFAALSSFTITHSLPGQMALTEVAITVGVGCVCCAAMYLPACPFCL